jgi:hypothetical protein
MGSSRGKNSTENNLSNQSQQAYDAWQPTALETKQNDRTIKFLDDWDSGKDIGEMDAVKPYFNLYNSAVNRDADEQGVGAMGFNDLTGGGNGKMAALVGEQLKSRRQQDASGQLYGAANQAYSDAQNEGNVLSGMAEGRMAGKAGLAEQRYSAYLNRPRVPSIWEKLLLGGVQAAGQVGAAYAGA